MSQETLERLNARRTQRALEKEQAEHQQENTPPTTPVERQQQRREQHRQNTPHPHEQKPTTPEVTIPDTDNVYHTVRKRGGRIVTRKGPQPERKTLSLFGKKKAEVKA